VAERLEGHARRKSCCGGSEDIAALERGCAARPGRQLHRLLQPNLLDHDRKQAIVRADVEQATGAHRQAPPGAADPGIHHHEVDGSSAEVARARKKHERARENVEARHLMADVDQHRVRAAGQHDTLHGRHQGRARTEIAGKGDDRRPG
jgi:hypothetical protein